MDYFQSTNLISSLLLLIFLVIALLHVYWGLRGTDPNSDVLPKINGKAAFVPSRFASFAVATCFFIAAGLIAMKMALMGSVFSENILQWLILMMSLVFLARAIGDFKLVGFFKKIKGSGFARLDTLYFSPLCLGISVGLVVIA